LLPNGDLMAEGNDLSLLSGTSPTNIYRLAECLLMWPSFAAVV
jgi:hypothetical protein